MGRVRTLLLLCITFCTVWQSTGEEEEGFGAQDDEGSDCGCAATSRDAFQQHGIDSEMYSYVLTSGSKLVHEKLSVFPQEKLFGFLLRDSRLLRVPEGEFTMGTDDPQILADGESPARRVFVSEFLLQETEVSNRQFVEFVHKTGFVTEAEKFNWSFCFFQSLDEEIKDTVDKQVDVVPWWVPVQGSNWFYPFGPSTGSTPRDVVSMGLLDFPVTHVSHNDARAFCEWKGLRLPREAEFERAAKGGIEGVLYSWGKELTPDGKHRANLWQGSFPDENTGEDGYLWSAPVDSFGAQNEFGLKNIIGNVWEWVADAWTTRHHIKMPDGSILKDIQVEIEGKIDDPTVERVKKGGSYMCHISYCYRYRVDARSSNSADSSAQNLGFRCAKDVEEV